MILPPMAAWIRIFEHVLRDQLLQLLAHGARPRFSAADRWTNMDASTGSSLTRIDILTRSSRPRGNESRSGGSRRKA